MNLAPALRKTVGPLAAHQFARLYRGSQRPGNPLTGERFDVSARIADREHTVSAVKLPAAGKGWRSLESWLIEIDAPSAGVEDRLDHGRGPAVGPGTLCIERGGKVDGPVGVADSTDISATADMHVNGTGFDP